MQGAGISQRDIAGIGRLQQIAVMLEVDRGELQRIGGAGQVAAEIHFLQSCRGREFDVQLLRQFTGLRRVESELAIELGHGAERNAADIVGVDERAFDFQFLEVEIRLGQLAAELAFDVERAERGDVDRQLEAREFRQGVDLGRVEGEVAGDHWFRAQIDLAGEAGLGEFGRLREFLDVDRQRVERAGDITLGVDLAQFGKVERHFDVGIVEQRADGFRARRERAVQRGHGAERDAAIVARLDEVGAERRFERRGLTGGRSFERVEIGADVEPVALEEAFRVEFERLVQRRHRCGEIQFAQLVARAGLVVLEGEARVLEAQMLHGAVESAALRSWSFGRRLVLEHPVGRPVRFFLERHRRIDEGELMNFDTLAEQERGPFDRAAQFACLDHVRAFEPFRVGDLHAADTGRNAGEQGEADLAVERDLALQGFARRPLDLRTVNGFRNQERHSQRRADQKHKNSTCNQGDTLHGPNPSMGLVIR